MKIKKFISILLVLTFVFMSFSVLGTPKVVSAESTKSDLSFFSLDPE